MKSISSILFYAFIFLLSTNTVISAQAHTIDSNPKVVVSITPFYGLVAFVMTGIGTPTLLIKAGTSPHDYALRPSDIQLLNNAELIFWGGPTLETFLIKPLNNMKALSASKQENAKAPIIVEFDNTPKLFLLPLRHSATWDSDEHQHTNKDYQGFSMDKSDQDMHFWLDPHNAIILTDVIVNYLVKLDPVHAPLYEKNGKLLKLRLKKLDENITRELSTVKNIPYIVFHDAYQYFEHRYDLQGVGSITLNPEIPSSAKRLSLIRKKIEASKAVCVFREPQFQPKLVDSIVEDLNVRTGELDPEGQSAHNNSEGYFTLLENLSHAIKACLIK